MLNITFWKNIVRWFVNSNTHFFLDIASSEGMKFTQQEGKYDGRNWSSKFTQQEMMEAPGALPVWVCWSSGGNCGLPKGQGGSYKLKTVKKWNFWSEEWLWKKVLWQMEQEQNHEAKGSLSVLGGSSGCVKGLQLQREKNTPRHQMLIKFYFWFFKGNLLFISVQIYLIISWRES